MNNHQFYNLLENRISNPRLHNNGIYKFSDEFIQSYNGMISKIEKLKYTVIKELEKMTELEKRHFELVSQQRELLESMKNET